MGKRAAAWGLLVTDLTADVAITVMAILHTAQSATVPGTAALALMAATIGMAVVSPADADGYANLTYLPWMPPELALAAGLAALACFPVSVASVVIRYRRSGIIQRQQIRWVAWAAGIFVAVYLISVLPVLPQAFTDSETMNVAVFVAYALVPVSIGFAILRYRLYDIDKIVSRTVSYAVITATLAGVYAGGVALATGVLPFSGQVGTAVSVLAAMALFAPLRRRVQRAVDRRFNRARYDAEAVTAAFARQMREPADIDAVGASLAAAVTQTLGPAHASLWVRGEPAAGPRGDELVRSGDSLPLRPPRAQVPDVDSPEFRQDGSRAVRAAWSRAPAPGQVR
jgi:hypothetical protein